MPTNKIFRKVTCRRISDDLNLDINRKTINNWLLKRDYSFNKQEQVIKLTPQHKAKRIEIAFCWLQENFDWENCIFSDEKVFSLDNWLVLAIT